MAAKKAFDLVVIGAGIVGSIAAVLARRQYPEWDILLLDQSTVGGGATRYSAGIDVPLGKTLRQRRMWEISTLFYTDLRSRLPEVPISDIPMYWFISNISRESFAKQIVDGLPPPASKERIAQLRKILPSLKCPERTDVLEETRASHALPATITDLLVREFEHTTDSSLWEGVRIVNVRHTPDCLDIRRLDNQPLQANRAIVTIGPWVVGGLGSRIFESMPMRVKKIVALHVNQCPPAGAPAFGFFADDAYLIPEHERGRWLFSFTSKEWDVAAEAESLYISQEDYDEGQEILAQYLPELVHDCVSGRVFCDAYTEDQTPYVGRPWPEDSRLAVAGGCSGSGYRLAPAVAQEALDLLVCGQEGVSVAS